MFWKILQWVQFLVSLILDAEAELGGGGGADKRQLVLFRAGRELGAIATAAQVGGCDTETLLSYAGQIVDGTVGILNCFGVLKHSPAIAGGVDVGAPSSSSPGGG